MGPLVLGILLVVLAYLVPLPFPIPTLLYIVGVLAILYGLWVLFLGGPRGPVDGRRRGVRWY